MKIVIARWNEDVEWAAALENAVIIQKDYDVPNAGRETSSHLHYILKNYDELEGEYVFCQGNPFDHCPTFLKDLETKTTFGPDWGCDGSGNPMGTNGDPFHKLPLEDAALRLGLPVQTRYRFTGGAQFKVTADSIKLHSKGFYQTLCNFAMNVYEGPYMIERLWFLIFPELNT